MNAGQDAAGATAGIETIHDRYATSVLSICGFDAAAPGATIVDLHRLWTRAPAIGSGAFSSASTFVLVAAEDGTWRLRGGATGSSRESAALDDCERDALLQATRAYAIALTDAGAQAVAASLVLLRDAFRPIAFDAIQALQHRAAEVETQARLLQLWREDTSVADDAALFGAWACARDLGRRARSLLADARCHLPPAGADACLARLQATLARSAADAAAEHLAFEQAQRSIDDDHASA